MADVTSLLTAKEMAEKLKETVSPERLLELSEAGMAPHYIVDGEVMFGAQETKEWVNHNLVVRRPGSHIGGEMLTAVNVMPATSDVSVPVALRAIAGMLIPMSVSGAETLAVPGVYFLCHGEQVVYVGQSINVFGRVGAHIGNKTFDRVYFVRVPESDLNFVEGRLIEQLAPRYNHDKTGRIVAPRVNHNSLYEDSQQVVKAICGQEQR
jgi:hypothetical protein